MKYLFKDGHWIPRDEYYVQLYEAQFPAVMPDIKPYQSMVTGEIIQSRSRHREHLKEHGCIEIGNETQTLLTHYDRLPKDVSPQKRHELIREQVNAMSQREFKEAIKRDVDRVKWSSRED